MLFIPGAPGARASGLCLGGRDPRVRPRRGRTRAALSRCWQQEALRLPAMPGRLARRAHRALLSTRRAPVLLTRDALVFKLSVPPGPATPTESDSDRERHCGISLSVVTVVRVTSPTVTGTQAGRWQVLS